MDSSLRLPWGLARSGPSQTLPQEEQGFDENEKDDDPLQTQTHPCVQEPKAGGPRILEIDEFFPDGAEPFLQIKLSIKGNIKVCQGFAFPGFRRVIEKGSGCSAPRLSLPWRIR